MSSRKTAVGGLIVSLVTATLMGHLISGSPAVAPMGLNSADSQARFTAANLAKLPLSFEANQGQSDPEVRFQSQGSGYHFFLTGQELSLNLEKVKPIYQNKPLTSLEGNGKVGNFSSQKEKVETVTNLHMKWLGSNSNPQISGIDKQSGVTNYLSGSNPARWQTNIPEFGRVAYQEIYPGIDLNFYGNQGQLEYDFVVKPQGSPLQTIRLSFEGATSLELNQAGALVVHVEGGDIVQPAPQLYQEVNGTRQKVEGNFKLLPQGAGILPLVGFESGPYDASRNLVIDPSLVYSTYLGGSGNEVANSIVVDSSGNAYISGYTSSTNFPTKSGSYETTFNGQQDIFVSKINPNGTGLVYSTYLGDSNVSNTTGLAVDNSGNAYVSGYTDSVNFPVTPGAFQTTLHGSSDMFVTKLNPTGTGLVYSTYLGGSGNDYESGLAIDSSGNAYISGYTTSVDFPTTSGSYQTVFGGFRDTTVTKLNPAGTGLVYSTYFGGSGYDDNTGIAIDSSGNAYITGSTSSSSAIAKAGGFQTVYSGSASDIFVTKFNPGGTALVYSTYLGGNDDDSGGPIAVDSSGNAYVAGSTKSTNYPVTSGAYQTAASGNYDGLVTKLNSSGSGLIYSTYLGRAGNDFIPGLVLDANGSAYFGGSTTSSNLPTTAGAPQSAFGGGSWDAFVGKLNAAGNSLDYLTYLGGNGFDFSYSIALDGNNDIFVTGLSYSTNFPTSPGAFQTSSGGGGYDAFVTKLKTPKICVVNNTLDEGATPGTLRNALLQTPKCDIINFNYSSTIFFNVNSTPLPAVPTGVTINGVCQSGQPIVTIQGVNTNGNGLYLSGNDTLNCLNIEGFNAAAVKALGTGSAGPNKLSHVIVGKTTFA